MSCSVLILSHAAGRLRECAPPDMRCEVVTQVEALHDALRKGAFDVVLAAELETREILRAVSISNELKSRAPMLVVSESCSEREVIELVRAGVDDVVRRFDTDIVRGAILLALARAERRGLADASDDLRARFGRAVEASRAKTTLLSLVAHELTTPLQMLLMGIDALRETTEDQAETLNRVDRAAHRLLALVDSLLEFVRMDTGQMQARFEQVSLESVAREVVGDLTAEAEDKGLSLRLRVESTRLAHTDPKLLRHVLNNLVRNAIKYTDQGSVEIAIDYDTCHIIRVVDSGQGIPPEKQESIFEPFTQLQMTRGRRSSGVGLGLTLVREMVRLLRGEIAVTSEVGTGSEFTLRLRDL